MGANPLRKIALNRAQRGEIDVPRGERADGLVPIAEAITIYRGDCIDGKEKQPIGMLDER